MRLADLCKYASYFCGAYFVIIRAVSCTLSCYFCSRALFLHSKHFVLVTELLMLTSAARKTENKNKNCAKYAPTRAISEEVNFSNGFSVSHLFICFFCRFNLVVILLGYSQRCPLRCRLLSFLFSFHFTPQMLRTNSPTYLRVRVNVSRMPYS